jgi:hypothetical protein
MKRLIALFLLAFLLYPMAPAMGGEIYKVIHRDGSVSYSDQPPMEEVSEEVVLPDLILLPAVEVPTVSSLNNGTSSIAQQKIVRIHSPLDEEVLHGTDNRLSINVSVSPSIAEDERLQLMHNGNPYGSAQSSGQWNLAQLNLGIQRFSVHLVDSGGQILSQSASITVYVIP